MTRAERFYELVPFRADISRELAGGLARISYRRLFVLVMVCDLRGTTKDPIRDAALQAGDALQGRMGRYAVTSIWNLRHSSNVRIALRGLREIGIVVRSSGLDSNRRAMYYATARARRCLTTYRRKARRVARSTIPGRSAGSPDLSKRPPAVRPGALRRSL